MVRLAALVMSAAVAAALLPSSSGHAREVQSDVHLVNGSFLGVRSVFTAELDGDGDLDVLGVALSAGSITWWSVRGPHPRVPLTEV